MSAVFTPSRTRISVERYQKMVAAGVLTKYDRIELIEGEMIDMAPIGKVHSAITSQLHELLVTKLSGAATVVSGGPVNLGNFSEPQPDLMVLKRRDDFYRAKIPDAADVMLLIEVSDTSLAFDQSIKLNLYARYGVTEYWVVDVTAKRVLVHRQPSQGAYAQQVEVLGQETVSPLAFPDFKIAVSELLP